MRELRV